MTAHSEITGTRVLVAPPYIRGPMTSRTREALKQARVKWLQNLPGDVTRQEVGDALGISRQSASELMIKHRGSGKRPPERHKPCTRGIIFGSLSDAVVKGMIWEQQEAMENHCARTGQTIAEALVELWATVHAGEQA